ncbi:MAG: D-alanyl-D-alanine carboxypeptidase/D-alanyl-D-alanine-endopeptidase, partial [Planctomycetota bacterium]
WYAAPVGALNYSDNCVEITVHPGGEAGAPVRVSVRPPNPLVEIVNRCRTGRGRDPVLHHPPGTFRYVVSGRCRKEWAFPPVAFPDPGLLFAASFRNVLAQEGIVLNGTVRRERVRLDAGTLPSRLTVVARWRTPIGDVLKRIGKNSQNLFAECLLKRTGYAFAKAAGDPRPVGSWSNGQRAVQSVLAAAGVDPKGFSIADGSGLSRTNACTPRQLVELLVWMRRRPGGPMFLESLSVNGVDGSLKRHLQDAAGMVHAKTGTMRGVRTLAGYVGPAGRPRYAFAVLFNGYKGGSGPYRKLQDRFCRVLIDALPDAHSSE